VSDDLPQRISGRVRCSDSGLTESKRRQRLAAMYRSSSFPTRSRSWMLRVTCYGCCERSRVGTCRRHLTSAEFRALHGQPGKDHRTGGRWVYLSVKPNPAALAVPAVDEAASAAPAPHLRHHARTRRRSHHEGQPYLGIVLRTPSNGAASLGRIKR